MEHQCSKCDTVGEVGPGSKFKCVNCGYETEVLMRRELVDLNHPVEGKIVLEMAAKMLRKD